MACDRSLLLINLCWQPASNMGLHSIFSPTPSVKLIPIFTIFLRPHNPNQVLYSQFRVNQRNRLESICSIIQRINQQYSIDLDKIGCGLVFHYFVCKCCKCFNRMGNCAFPLISFLAKFDFCIIKISTESELIINNAQILRERSRNSCNHNSFDDSKTEIWEIQFIMLRLLNFSLHIAIIYYFESFDFSYWLDLYTVLLLFMCKQIFLL